MSRWAATVRIWSCRGRCAPRSTILKGMAVHYVMSPRENEPVYYQQRTLLADLVDALYEAGADCP